MDSKNLRRRISRILEKLAEHQGQTMLARIGRGQPFRSLVATILSARVRDEMTEKVVPEMMRRWPNARSLARARPSQVEKVIRKIGLYRTKSVRLVEVARSLVRDHGGKVPNDLDALTRLPGVGRKTAGCVVVYAFGGDAIPVDTHVHRISNRMEWVKTRHPEKTEQALYNVVPRKWWAQVNDLLVRHGKEICRPITPRCAECPVKRNCPFPGRKSKRPT